MELAWVDTKDDVDRVKAISYILQWDDVMVLRRIFFALFELEVDVVLAGRDHPIRGTHMALIRSGWRILPTSVSKSACVNNGGAFIRHD